ncbi:rhodanese-like domain-containing protein [Sorangium sp. So ce233]|uniref:rhodanese-like domain-containing protein n=1 Tax=Sorangium sp. So ce233 TaxID=3133290 RepID=UPI003F5E75EF
MADIKRVSPEQAKKLIEEEGYLYLDVRSEPEYAAGHPSGAHNVPLLHAGPGGMKPNPDFLDVVCALYPKDAKILVGCRSGQRSMRAAEAMVSAGYTAVIDQRAGFEGPRDAFGALTERGWGPAGLPVETTTAGASYAELRQKAGR